MTYKMPHKKGQQPKISPGRVEKLLQALAAGQYHDTACQLAGVHMTTSNSWIRRGQDELSRVGAFEDEPEVLVADWLSQFPDDFRADNPMWFMDPPSEHFDANEWLYVLYALRVQKARAIAEASALSNIRVAARNGFWQADAWYLERTRPNKFGRKDTLAHQGVEGGPAIAVNDTSVQGLDQRVMAVLEAMKEKTDDE